jgi:hypothetical protein
MLNGGTNCRAARSIRIRSARADRGGGFEISNNMPKIALET